MTIASNVPRVTLNMNGITTDIPFPYPVLSSADMKVIETILATGVETVKVLTTDFVIPEVPDGAGRYLSGLTIRANTPPPGTVSWTAINDPVVTQLVDLTNGGPLPVDTQVESPLDRLTLIVQRTRDLISRAFRQPDGDPVQIGTLPPVAQRPNKYLGFDVTGNTPVMLAAPTSTSLTTAYSQTLLDDPDSATARVTLDASKTEPLDNIFKIVGSGDATKKIRFEVDGVTPGQTRVATVPDFDFTLGSLPPGVGPLPYAGAVAPNGFLMFGSDYSRAAYPNLFAIVGTKYGAGDGVTTFGLHIEGRLVIAAGTGTSVASGVNADVDTATDGFTVPANASKWVTGTPVVFSLASGTITGLTSGNNYFVVRSSSTLIKLASSLANAQNGTVIDLTAKSSPVWSITYTMTARTAGDMGGAESHAESSVENLAHAHNTQGSTATLGTAGSGSSEGYSTSAVNCQRQTAVTSTGGNAAMDIMNPFVVSNMIISY